MMSENLHHRCMQSLRQRNAQRGMGLSEDAMLAITNELIAHASSRQLGRLTDTFIDYYLTYRSQVRSLLDPSQPDHHDQWHVAIRRIRYIARLRGFGETGDSAVELDDIVQTIASEFHLSLQRFSYACTLETWLHSITIRQLQRFLRNRGAAKRTAIYAPFERAELVPDPSADEAHIHGAELAEQIRQILERQKDGKRLAQVFLLHALADQSAEAIGKLIRRNPSRVRAMLNIAREILRRELANDNTDVL